MKKLIIALAFCLVAVGLITAPVMATAQKVTLNAQNGATGTGFVIVNTSTGLRGEWTISVKGLSPNTKYAIATYYLVPGDLPTVNLGGTEYLLWWVNSYITTNQAGNASTHFNTKEPAGSINPGFTEQLTFAVVNPDVVPIFGHSDFTDIPVGSQLFLSTSFTDVSGLFSDTTTYIAK